MNFFKKEIRPEDLGAILYESIRSGMENDGSLSVETFIRAIDREPSDLDENFRGEIAAGLMFAATLAIEKSATPKVAHRILGGLKTEFFDHLQEQGANAIQQAEWEAVLANRFLTYRKSLEEYSGFEPPWKLGREFFWNIIGEQAHIAIAVKIATLFLLEGQDMSQKLLNVYGPTLIVPAEV